MNRTAIAVVVGLALIVLVFWTRARAEQAATVPLDGVPLDPTSPLERAIAIGQKAAGIGGAGAALLSPLITSGAATAAATSAAPAAVATSTGATAGGLGIGVAATVGLIALPIGIFLLAGYFGRPCPQTPEVYAAFQRALAACGNQNPGYYGYDVSNWMSFKGPGYQLLLQNGGSFRAMTEAQLNNFIVWRDGYGRTVPDSVKGYVRAKWLWAHNADAQYAEANLITDC